MNSRAGTAHKWWAKKPRSCSASPACESQSDSWGRTDGTLWRRCTPAHSSSLGQSVLLAAASSEHRGILYRHPPYWLINNALRMYKDASSKTPLWLFHLFLNLRSCRACADSPVLALQPTNKKKNPIAMFRDDFNVLLLGRDNIPRLNLKAFSKKAVL